MENKLNKIHLGGLLIISIVVYASFFTSLSNEIGTWGLIVGLSWVVSFDLIKWNLGIDRSRPAAAMIVFTLAILIWFICVSFYYEPI